MRWLVDEAYPDVPVIRLVLDNLKRIGWPRLRDFPGGRGPAHRQAAFHHTPKHGSWLNMAEIEFSVLARACLRGRNGDEDSLERPSAPACQSGTDRSYHWRLPKTPDANSIASIPANPDLVSTSGGLVALGEAHTLLVNGHGHMLVLVSVYSDDDLNGANDFTTGCCCCHTCLLRDGLSAK